MAVTQEIFEKLEILTDAAVRCCPHIERKRMERETGMMGNTVAGESAIVLAKRWQVYFF